MGNQFETIKDAVIVRLSGEIDQHTASVMRDRIDIEIINSKEKNLIIDLDGVTFMDSSGIGLLVGRYKTAKSVGSRLILCGGSSNIRKMIEMSGIRKILLMYPDIQEAKKSLEKIK